MQELETWAGTIISSVGPNAQSEFLRRAVYNYLRRLILNTLVATDVGNQEQNFTIFRHGSVPLMTYLADGDLDIGFAVFGKDGAMKDEQICDHYLSVLYTRFSQPDMFGHAIFPVRNPTLIDAEVRILKCSIRNIPIDICANKVGGCCAYIMLDLCDRIFKRNHLLKRAIVLIKCWCAYESHTLGSRNGLMSTYALEILIVNIFYLYYRELHTPLQVLIKFLEYYSSFEWDKYAVTVCGPIPMKMLRELEYKYQNERNDASSCDPHLEEYAASHTYREDGLAILSIVETCRKRFRRSYDFFCNGFQRHSWRYSKFPSDGFAIKSINIVNPLNNFNNSGRSVSESCFMRIRAAFEKGYKIISQILETPGISDKFCDVFFKNSFCWLRGRFTRLESADAMMWLPSWNALDMQHSSVLDEHGNDDGNGNGGSCIKSKKLLQGKRAEVSEEETESLTSLCYHTEANAWANNSNLVPFSFPGASSSSAVCITEDKPDGWCKSMTYPMNQKFSQSYVSQAEKATSGENALQHVESLLKTPSDYMDGIVNEPSDLSNATPSLVQTHEANLCAREPKLTSGNIKQSSNASEIRAKLSTARDGSISESTGYEKSVESTIDSSMLNTPESDSDVSATLRESAVSCDSHRVPIKENILRSHSATPLLATNTITVNSTSTRLLEPSDYSSERLKFSSNKENASTLSAKRNFYLRFMNNEESRLEELLLSVDMLDPTGQNKCDDGPQEHYSALEGSNKKWEELYISERDGYQNLNVFESDLEEVLGLIKFCEMIWLVPPNSIDTNSTSYIWPSLLLVSRFLNQRSPKSSLLCLCPFNWHPASYDNSDAYPYYPVMNIPKAPFNYFRNSNGHHHSQFGQGLHYNNEASAKTNDYRGSDKKRMSHSHGNKNNFKRSNAVNLVADDTFANRHNNRLVNYQNSPNMHNHANTEAPRAILSPSSARNAGSRSYFVPANTHRQALEARRPVILVPVFPYLSTNPIASMNK